LGCCMDDGIWIYRLDEIKDLFSVPNVQCVMSEIAQVIA